MPRAPVDAGAKRIYGEGMMDMHTAVTPELRRIGRHGTDLSVKLGASVPQCANMKKAA